MDHLKDLPMDSLKDRPLPTDSLKEVHPLVHLLHMEVPLQEVSQEITCSQFLRIHQLMGQMELRLIQPNKIGMPTLEDRWEEAMAERWEQAMADRWEEAMADRWEDQWDNLEDKWEETMVD